MSYFGKPVEVGRRAGSDSSGDATPTPKTPTNAFFPPNGRLTPSPHYTSSRSTAGRHGDTRQDLRYIWEDANRPKQPPSMPHVVFPESPSSSENSATSSRHKPVDVPGSIPITNTEPDATDWETGLERLRLETVLQQSKPAPDLQKILLNSASSNSAAPLPDGYYPYYPHPDRPHAISAPESVPIGSAQPALQPKRVSIWSTYGSHKSPRNTSRDGEITPISMSYSQYSVPKPAPPAPTASLRARASSESSFNASADLHQSQRRFASQPNPPIPVRLGQSQFSSQARPPAVTESYQSMPFYLQPRNQGFLPMHAIRTGREPSSIPSRVPSYSLINPVPSTRFSDRYHGMHTESNASADHLAADQNASLWVTNLPPDITHHELLSQIRRIGRIWCCFINGPDGMKHTTAAAKIVFFKPCAAQRLLQHAVDHGLQVRGFRAKVTQNRIKTGETIPRGGDDSRVLIVTGQAHFVNKQTLIEYFNERFVFQLDEVKELIKGGSRAVMEFRFGSYRCQAQMGKISLEKDRPLGFEKAEFGEDPCEVGDTYSSHDVALQRIRGIGI